MECKGTERVDHLVLPAKPEQPARTQMHRQPNAVEEAQDPAARQYATELLYKSFRFLQSAANVEKDRLAEISDLRELQQCKDFCDEATDINILDVMDNMLNFGCGSGHKGSKGLKDREQDKVPGLVA